MSDDLNRRFMEMLTAHQRDLYCYVNMLMAGDPATPDVVQDTNMDLWSKMNLFDPHRPFLPWAMKFAHNRVLAFRKARGRSRLVFSDEFLDALSEDCQANPGGIDDQLSALRHCLQQLPPEHLKLVTERYQASLPVKTLASRAGMTANGVSAQLYRIRKSLAKCIESRVPHSGGGLST